jgi:hypothetical protein
MADYSDGFYCFEELRTGFNPDFNSEKELCNFIECHINDFCYDFLDLQYESHQREYKLVNTNRGRIKGNRRIDFLIKSSCGKTIIIECKHPQQLCELSTAVGQCLSYISLLSNFNIKVDRTILLSTRIDNVTPQIITDFNLPVEFMTMDKTKCVKFSHYVKT